MCVSVSGCVFYGEMHSCYTFVIKFLREFVNVEKPISYLAPMINDSLYLTINDVEIAVER